MLSSLDGIPDAPGCLCFFRSNLMQLKLCERFSNGGAFLDEPHSLVNPARGRRDAVALDGERNQRFSVFRWMDAVDATVDDKNLSAISIFGGDGETVLNLFKVLLPRCSRQKDRVFLLCESGDVLPLMPFGHAFELFLWPLQTHEGVFCVPESIESACVLFTASLRSLNRRRDQKKSQFGLTTGMV